MRGLKRSIFVLLLTVSICFLLINNMQSSLKTEQGVLNVYAADEHVEEGETFKEGTFPGYVNYEFADQSGIYYVKYNNRDSIFHYNTETGKSRIVMTAVESKRSMHDFCRQGEYMAWEEDKGPIGDHDETLMDTEWTVFVKGSEGTTKVDEGVIKDNSLNPEYLIPQRLSMYADSMVYKGYSVMPGTSDSGIVIKLYDMKKNKDRIIFSTSGIRNTLVSDPYIYKNFIVWSIAKVAEGSNLSVEKSDIYIFDTKTGVYSRLENGQNLINPVIWEDYIVCSSISSTGPSVTIINIKTGMKKDIASSDLSLSPRKEITDFTLGDGYVTWNTSYADSIWAYDIKNDSLKELKKSDKSDKTNNKLLNIKIFGKTIYYTDHVYNTKDGSTISEINKYIVLQ